MGIKVVTGKGMATVFAKINHEMLIWARQTSGYTIDEVAKRTSISANTLKNAESGDRELTMIQLRKVAKYYKRPLPIFYLEKAPDELRLPDFRSNKEIGFDKLSGNIQIRIREILEKKKFAEEFSLNYSMQINYEFDRMFSENDKPEDTALQIRQLLQLNENDLKGKRDNEVLKYWINKIENLNILVFQFQKVDPEIMRGFVFTLPPFPTIALNSRDTYYARVFTILHELTHIIVNRTGICEAIYDQDQVQDNVEQFCNKVAGSTLVPANLLEKALKEQTIQTKNLDKLISNLSNQFKVSSSVVLIRLLNLQKITSVQFHSKLKELKKQRESTQGTKGSGGDYYRGLYSRTSKKYIKMIFDKLQTHDINYYDAMKYLNLKYHVLETLENKIDSGELK